MHWSRGLVHGLVSALFPVCLTTLSGSICWSEGLYICLRGDSWEMCLGVRTARRGTIWRCCHVSTPEWFVRANQVRWISPWAQVGMFFQFLYFQRQKANGRVLISCQRVSRCGASDRPRAPTKPRRACALVLSATAAPAQSLFNSGFVMGVRCSRVYSGVRHMWSN